MANEGNIYGIVMKFPVPGMVKTRLAQDIGEVGAADIYRQLTEGMLRRTRQETGKYERIIFYSPADMRDRFENWLPGERLSPQRGSDIGEVMSNAFSEMFGLGAARAVITGTDIPGLRSEIIEQAFVALDSHDVVMGPAKDGGYYLVGLKVPRPELFRGLSWGTERVYGETVSLIDALGLTMSAVESLGDIDTVNDLPELEKNSTCL